MKGYSTDRFGIIHQADAKPTVAYNLKYVEDSCEGRFKDETDKLAILRYGFITGAIGEVATCLDVGYGNGAFLKVMHGAGIDCCGTDISGWPVPEGCKQVEFNRAITEPYDLVTFFDSLEHIPNLEFLVDMSSHFLVATLPFCHYPISKGEEWFKIWPHLKPSEHLHHFNPRSLDRLMRQVGYKLVRFASVEDIIRIPADGIPGTFTSVYER